MYSGTNFYGWAVAQIELYDAKTLAAKIVKGYPKRKWQKTRDRNEALDCRIYARAAAIALGIDRWSEQKWEQIASI
ncbi:MAG: phage terminase large subunit family protein [Alphaproteobacteria bacterium]|nr:phage terminase large subunit family protein [Alphaproteobacteria bacterium]